MTVYVDLLFGLNAAINYLLLRASAAIGGCPVKLWRFLAAAALGGCYAVLTVLPGLAFLQGSLWQLICAGGMLVLAFGWKRYTVRQALFFFALSFAFGGAVFLLIQWAEPDCRFLGGRAYYAVSTPALLLLAALGYGLSAVVLSGWGAHTGGEIQTVQLTLGQKSCLLRVLRDTGNTLRDPITGQSVLVLDPGAAEKLSTAPVDRQALRDPAGLLEQLRRQQPGLRCCLIPYHTVGVDQGLLLAVRGTVTRGRKKEAVWLAISPTTVSSTGQFDAIWGGELV